MAKIKKKGQVGAAKNYITRNQAIRKLQISLPDFRRLCIWKGIFPREPRSRKKVSRSSTNSTTFYYAKDVQYLLHEPLLQRFRDHKALEKKISRALGRGDVSDARRLDAGTGSPDRTGRPRHALDHVVRERYPTFADALRDLDDCLSMLFLFANLPASDAVPARMVARCERLCLEFQHFLIVSRSLRKSFLSIKGVYYQATVQGEDVLWLVPYRFNQRVVGDVDFRIMGTFVEFYMTLLGFVNFRLYTSVGLKYPPRFDRGKDDGSAELGAFTLEGRAIGFLGDGTEATTMSTTTATTQMAVIAGDGGRDQGGPDPEVQAAVNKVVEGLNGAESKSEAEAEVEAERGAVTERRVKARPEAEASSTTADDETATDGIDKFEPVAPGGDVLPQPDSTGLDAVNLFADCVFFIAREAPRQPLELLLRAFGCQRVGWDAVLGAGAFTTDEKDPRITHQVVDRPPVQAAEDANGDSDEGAGPGRRVPGRFYVQPQWVWDSVNDGELKRPDLYAPGASLPPHLSPFVRPVQGQYDPSMPLEAQEEEGEGEGEGEKADAGSNDDSFEDFSADEEEEEEEEEEGAGGEGGDRQRGPVGKSGDGDGDGDEEENDEEDAAAERRAELEAEISGAAVRPKEADRRAQARQEARRKLARKNRDEAEELERAKGMLSKKKRKLFEQMQYSNSKKSDEARALRAKRRKIEKKKRGGGEV